MHIRIEVTDNWRIAEAITPLMNLWEYYHTQCFDPDHWSADRVHQNMIEGNNHGHYFVGSLMIPTVEYCLACGIEVDPYILEWIEECRERAGMLVEFLRGMKSHKSDEMDALMDSDNDAKTAINSRSWHEVDYDLHEAELMLRAFTMNPEKYKGAEKVEFPETCNE